MFGGRLPPGHCRWGLMPEIVPTLNSSEETELKQIEKQFRELEKRKCELQGKCSHPKRDNMGRHPLHGGYRCTICGEEGLQSEYDKRKDMAYHNFMAEIRSKSNE